MLTNLLGVRARRPEVWRQAALTGEQHFGANVIQNLVHLDAIGLILGGIIEFQQVDHHHRPIRQFHEGLYLRRSGLHGIQFHRLCAFSGFSGECYC